MLQNLMTQWLYISDYDTALDQAFISKAKINGVDLEQRYIAVVLSGDQRRMPEHRLALNLDAKRRIYVLSAEGVQPFLDALSPDIFAGVGGAHFDISTGIKEALFAVLLTNEFERVVIFNRVGYLYDLVKSDLAYPNVAAYYERIDDETWLTFWEYVQHMSSTKETACLMLVHPKTIVYRLNKICATTGLNPKQGVDLLPLIVTYVRKQTACFENLVNELQSLSDSLLPRDKVD